MWMTGSAMTAVWLWYTKAVDKVMGIKIFWAAGILLVTALGAHSVGAMALLVIGLTVLWLGARTKWPIWALGLMLIPPAWMITRASDAWSGKDLEAFIRQYDTRSADSLHYRLRNERKLVDRALEEPVYGWTGFKFNVKINKQTHKEEQIGTPDQMWVIMLGHAGLVGLISMTVMMLLPMALLMWRIPVRYWHLASAAPAAALAMMATIHMCDMLFNAMVNPIFLLGVGGVTGMTFSLRGRPREAQGRRASFRATSAINLRPGTMPA
jgi:hypothetical protein